jgi:hypothetical protein
MSEGRRFDWRRPLTLRGWRGIAVWAIVFVLGWIVLGKIERQLFYAFFILVYFGFIAIFKLSERPWRR